MNNEPDILTYEQLLESDVPQRFNSKPKAETFRELYDRAMLAGQTAAKACTPTPMVVGQAKDLFSNEIDMSKSVEVIYSGVCGFAWVKVKPATSAFAKWLKAQGICKGTSYTGGYDIRVGDYGQSMERKYAHASAMAKVLQNSGINCYAESRMD